MQAVFRCGTKQRNDTKSIFGKEIGRLESRSIVFGSNIPIVQDKSRFGVRRTFCCDSLCFGFTTGFLTLCALADFFSRVVA